MSNVCPFCEIVAGRAPATIVREWWFGLAIVPLNPVVPGHLLVIPRRHVPDFAADPAVSSTIAGYAAEMAVPPCNVITSVGAEATQTVRHLHLHVVPRAAGDGLALPWTGQES